MNHTDVFTEEGMTRLRNFRRRAAGYLAVWLLVGLLAGAALFWLHIKYGLRPLQRVYLKPYALASLKSLVSTKGQGVYVMLGYTVDDPATGKEKFMRVTDDDVEPVLDAEGRIVRDSILGLMFRLRVGVAHNYFYWRTGRASNAEMRAWMRENVYGGANLWGIAASHLGLGGVIFLVGITATLVRDRRSNRKYELGRRVRGTCLLTPEEYEDEHCASTGVGIVIHERREGRT